MWVGTYKSTRNQDCTDTEDGIKNLEKPPCLIFRESFIRVSTKLEGTARAGSERWEDLAPAASIPDCICVDVCTWALFHQSFCYVWGQPACTQGHWLQHVFTRNLPTGYNISSAAVLDSGQHLQVYC